MSQKEEYEAKIKAIAPTSPLFKNCLFAFLFGGGICAFGETFRHLLMRIGLESSDAFVQVSVTLIFLSAVLTGLGIYDNIAKIAGAGTLVPVTGFANAVVSPAIDTKSEGWVLGVGAKIFTVAGPVLLYGVLAGTVYGLIYYAVSLFGGGV